MLNYWDVILRYELVMQTLRCFGILVVFIIPGIAVMIIIRVLLKPPSFVFRKLLHIVAITGISLMILISGNWKAAALTSGMLAVAIYPILLLAEKQPWFENFLVQKSKGEIKRSMLRLFVMFAAVIVVAWGIFGKPEIAAASILMWGIGDAAAALVGIPFGKHKVHCRLTDGKKSWDGSLAMLIVSAAAGLFVLEMSQSEILTKAVIMTGAGAISGAMSELFSPSECDTITVPIIISAVLLSISV